jgi:hypothetical protein
MRLVTWKSKQALKTLFNNQVVHFIFGKADKFPS